MEEDQFIQLRVDKFKADLSYMEVTRMVRKYIISGDSYLLNSDKHYGLKEEIADHFQIHTNDVILVGSAKLGFSIAQDKRYRPFGDESDIDVAIVSGELFDKIWEQVFEYWDSVAGAQYWEQERSFKDYLFRGWIRPDMLPPARSFALRREWWEFFRAITSQGIYGPYKVAAGLYKSWYFLEKYHSICIRQCKQNLEEINADNGN